MKGCMTALFMWLPILISKTLKGLWLLISWILQTICGTPLYYCRPEYRIPAQMIGTIGLIFSFLSIFSIFISLFDQNYVRQYHNSGLDFMFSISIIGGIGLVFIIICRYLIRKGSI